MHVHVKGVVQDITHENWVAQDDIFKEIDILIGLDHPNVIFLKEYFEESNKVCPPAGANLQAPLSTPRDKLAPFRQTPVCWRPGQTCMERQMSCF